MLASLLPGLRDVRTPLTVGYLWLVASWVWFGGYLPEKRPTDDGVILRLFELSDLFGPGATIAAFSLAAYILGVLLTVPVGWSDLFIRWGYRVSEEAAQTRAAYHRMVSANQERIYEAGGPLGMSPQAMDDFESEIQRAMATSTSDLRPRLLVANQELYGEYDRLESEAAFRLNLCLPISALGTTALFTLSPWWGLATSLLVGGLLHKAVLTYVLAVSVVERAVLTGVIEHPTRTLLAGFQ